MDEVRLPWIRIPDGVLLFQPSTVPRDSKPSSKSSEVQENQPPDDFSTSWEGFSGYRYGHGIVPYLLNFELFLESIGLFQRIEFALLRFKTFIQYGSHAHFYVHSFG